MLRRDSVSRSIGDYIGKTENTLLDVITMSGKDSVS